MRRMGITQRRTALLAAIAGAALAVAPSAMAATPLTGESLSGNGTASTSGRCTLPTIYGSGTFSVSGMATGPYPGTFTETGGYGYSSVEGKQPYYLHFSASFSIT